MDYSLLLEKLKPNWLPLLLGMSGLVILLYGLIALNASQEKKDEIVFESAESQSSAKASAIEKQITIDIEGAVQKPGVYKLPADARVQDALIAAGGMSKDADREKVSKALNLAAKLADGGKIYIPFVGDPSINSGQVSSGFSINAGGSTVLGAETGSININSATSKELDSLPGIGEITAQKIISNRPYSAKEELLSKKIVSQKVFDQIKEKITVY